jgi:diguanylate cyclase (GGDEF)-like protein
LRREDPAGKDPLTGSANRATVTACLEQALAADRDGDVGVLFYDLDRFEQVNDRLGHAAGDDLLQRVAARLRR